VREDLRLGTSLSTSATCAGTVPTAQASAIATKFEPLPEPSTPMRNWCSLVTWSSYSLADGVHKSQLWAR